MWWMKDKNVKCLCLVNYALFILLWISKAICASFYSSQQFYIRYGGCCHMLCLIHADKFWSLPYCFTHHSIFHGHFHDVHTVFLSRLKKKVTAWIETKISLSTCLTTAKEKTKSIMWKYSWAPQHHIDHGSLHGCLFHDVPKIAFLYLINFFNKSPYVQFHQFHCVIH